MEFAEIREELKFGVKLCPTFLINLLKVFKNTNLLRPPPHRRLNVLQKLTVLQKFRKSSNLEKIFQTKIVTLKFLIEVFSIFFPQLSPKCSYYGVQNYPL